MREKVRRRWGAFALSCVLHGLIFFIPVSLGSPKEKAFPAPHSGWTPPRSAYAGHLLEVWVVEGEEPDSVALPDEVNVTTRESDPSPAALDDAVVVQPSGDEDGSVPDVPAPVAAPRPPRPSGLPLPSLQTPVPVVAGPSPGPVVVVERPSRLPTPAPLSPPPEDNGSMENDIPVPAGSVSTAPVEPEVLEVQEIPEPDPNQGETENVAVSEPLDVELHTEDGKNGALTNKDSAGEPDDDQKVDEAATGSADDEIDDLEIPDPDVEEPIPEIHPVDELIHELITEDRPLDETPDRWADSEPDIVNESGDTEQADDVEPTDEAAFDSVDAVSLDPVDQADPSEPLEGEGDPSKPLEGESDPLEPFDIEGDPDEGRDKRDDVEVTGEIAELVEIVEPNEDEETSELDHSDRQLEELDDSDDVDDPDEPDSVVTDILEPAADVEGVSDLSSIWEPVDVPDPVEESVRGEHAEAPGESEEPEVAGSYETLQDEGHLHARDGELPNGELLDTPDEPKRNDQQTADEDEPTVEEGGMWGDPIGSWRATFHVLDSEVDAWEPTFWDVAGTQAEPEPVSWQHGQSEGEDPIEPPSLEEPTWEEARLIHQVDPPYPRRARELGIEGVVVLELELDEQGVPVSARVVTSSNRLDLDTAAKEAAMQWRFSPARDNGVPVPTRRTVRIEFRLNPD